MPIIKVEIFPYLEGKDLINLSYVNTSFARLCRGIDDNFWKNKVSREFCDYVLYKKEEITWRQYYFLLISSRQIVVLSDDNIIRTTPDFIIKWMCDDIFPNASSHFIVQIKDKTICALDKNKENKTPLHQSDYLLILNCSMLHRLKIKTARHHLQSEQRRLLELIKEEGGISIHPNLIDELESYPYSYLYHLVHALSQVGLMTRHV